MYPSGNAIYDPSFNGTVTLEDLNERLFQLHIPAMVFVAVCMVIGIFGNLLVLVVYKKKFRRSNHRYFILFLAALDFTACSTGMPFLIASLRLPYLMPYAKLCKSMRYIHYLVNNASGLLLLVISVERFRKICHPFKSQITHRQILYLCYGTVFFSAVIAIPAAIFYGSSEIQTGINNLTGHQCYVDDAQKESILFELFQGLLLLETLLCIIIFIILYIFIVRKLWSSDQFLNAMRSMQMTSTKRSHDSSESTDMDQGQIEDSSETRFFKSSDDSVVKPLVTNGNTADFKTGVTPEHSQSVDNTNQSDLTVSDGNSQDSTQQTCITREKGSAEEQTNSKSLWRKSRELFRRKEHSNVKPSLNRSISDTRLNKAAQDPKFRSLSPTERLIVGNMIKSAMPTRTKKPKTSRTTARVTMMLFTVSVVFTFSFIPHLVLMIITVQDKTFLGNLTPSELIAYQVFLRSFVVNNVVNPIIYMFCDTKFRQLCKNYFCRTCK